MFKDVIGHATILHLLSKWLEKPASGYLFYGPSHLGKKAVAERFVGELLGVGALPPARPPSARPSKDASNSFRPVQGAPAATPLQAHPDFISIEPEEGKTIVSVEIVRKARSRLIERPMVAQRVVCFIPRLDRLNEEGMNALLKVLEEPPADAVFVAVAEDLSRLPGTIQSRLVKVPFSLVPQSEIVKGLLLRGISQEEADRRVSEARGRPGLAIEPHEGRMEFKKNAESFFVASSLGERLQLVEELTKACDSAESTSEAWGEALDEWVGITRQFFSREPLRAIVVGSGLVTARRFVGGALSPRLPLEAAAVRLAATDPLAHLLPTPIGSALPAIFDF